MVSVIRKQPTVRAVRAGTGLEKKNHTCALYLDANLVPVPAYHTVGLTVATDRLIPLSSQVGLRAFVTVENLTDRRYIGSAFVNPDVANGVPVAFEPGSPRTFVVSVSLGYR